MLGDSLRRRQRPRPALRGGAGAGRRGLRFWLPVGLGALAVPFAAGYLVMVFLVFPPLEVPAVGVPVPSLYGRSMVEAERALAQAGLGSLQAVEMPHPTAAVGAVLAQSPLPGQQLRPGADVRVSVSTGPMRVRLRDVLGLPVERAEEVLRGLGFTVQRLDGESPLEAGRVFATEPAVGSQLQLPAHVVLHVSLGPPAPDSLAFDSLGILPPDTMPVPR